MNPGLFWLTAILGCVTFWAYAIKFGLALAAVLPA
jgi:hypothetical protein